MKDEVDETDREGVKTLRNEDGKPRVSSLSSKDDDGLWQTLSIYLTPHQDSSVLSVYLTCD